MQTRLLSVMLAVVLLGAACGFGQSKTDISFPDLLQMKGELKAPGAQQTELRAVALDSPLDPSAYFVGPGDVLALHVWIATPVELQLTVTPEGILLIPNVGSVTVSGFTLDDARHRVVEFTQKKYPRADVSLNLITPRKVSVQIMGQVLNEGKQEMSAALRVSHLIEVADVLPPTQTTKEFYNADLPDIRRRASERFISIRRYDGTDRRVDLVKYDATRKSIFNPYLREGDMVYVPIRKADENNLGVFGAVVHPTSVEFVDGDSLSDLVAIAYGFRPNADPEHAWLARQSVDGNTMDTVRIDMAAVLGGRAPNIALRPGDRLVIPPHPEHRRGEFVTVAGEVAMPGRYPITPFSTKLSEAIRMAGGFTENANISASTLVRGRPYQTSQLVEAQMEELKSNRTYLPPQDSSYYRTETTLRLNGEAVSVDFRRLFVEGDTTQDVTLRDFDDIMVPFRQQTVYVFGQVVQPGHIALLRSKDYKYYVNLAGGFTNEARTSDIKVIKAGTKIWLDPDETTIEDGDFVWVPREAYYPFSYYLTTYSQIAAIVGTVATVLLLIRTWNR